MASYYRRNRGASSRFPRRTQYSNQRIYPKSTDIDAPPNVPPAIESFPWTDIINKEIPLFELRNRDLQISDERVKDEDLVGMKNFRRIATYNWMTSDSVHPTGTMVIPGVPRIYDSTVSKKIIKLKPDKWFVAYPDGYHSPDYPMEPVFRAIEECKPSDFNFQDHHILTDSACLKHFLCFGNEKLEPEEPPVRIDVERIGDLVVLSRQEKSPVYRFESSSAYGIDFKDCVTIDTDKDAPTNDNFHQVITYQFGQFNMIVSSKVDCCKTLEMKQDDKDGDTVDKLVKTLATGLDLNRDSYGKESKLSVIKYGSLRQFDMVELLTRKEGRELRWDKVWQRVFFTGAKHLLLGQVDLKTGLLHNVQAEELPQTPPSGFRGLRKCYFALRRIVDFVKGKKEGARFSVVIENTGDMRIFERDGTSFLPDNYCKRLFPLRTTTNTTTTELQSEP